MTDDPRGFSKERLLYAEVESSEVPFERESTTTPKKLEDQVAELLRTITERDARLADLERQHVVNEIVIGMHQDFLKIGPFDDFKRCPATAQRFQALDDRFDRVAVMLRYRDMRVRPDESLEEQRARVLAPPEILSVEGVAGKGDDIVGRTFGAWEGFSSQVIMSGGLPVYVNRDVMNDKRYLHLDGDLMRPESECVLPVIAPTGDGTPYVHALISIQSEQQDVFDDDLIKDLEQITYNQGLWVPFLRTATTDINTGCLVRSKFSVDFKTLFYRSLNGEQDLGLVIVDLNALKAVNDDERCGGHIAGDAYIAAAGKALLSVCDKRMTAYRYGGDELVLLVRQTNHKELRDLVWHEVRTAIDRFVKQTESAHNQQVRETHQGNIWRFPPVPASVGYGVLNHSLEELGTATMFHTDFMNFVDKYMRKKKGQFYENHAGWDRRTNGR